MTKSGKIKLISLIMLVGICAAILHHYVYEGLILGKKYPENTFLFRPYDRFGDWALPYYATTSAWLTPVPGPDEIPRYILEQKRGKASLSPLELPYILQALTRIRADIGLFIYLLAFILLFFILNYHYLNLGFRLKSLVYTAIWTFSYPALFAIDRANVDIWLVLLFATAVYCESRSKHWCNSLLFGFLAALKPPLGLFSFVYIMQRRWLAFFVSLTSAAIIFFGWAWLFPYWYKAPYQTHLETVEYYTNTFELLPIGVYYGHSIFGAFRLLIYLTCDAYQYTADDAHAIFSKSLVPYSIFTAIATVAVLVIIFLKRLEFWKILTCLCCLICLMPYVSADYRLLYFSVPMLLFVNSRQTRFWDALISILFGLLMIPKDYFHIKFNAQEVAAWDEATSSVLINPVVLTALLCCCLFSAQDKTETEKVS